MSQAKDYTAFFDDVAAIIGEENVSRDASSGAIPYRDGTTKYGDAFSVAAIHRAAGAVRPATVEEVQEVVRLANRHNTPLWTVSRGKNLGYGGSGPVVDGNVVLDLHRMKKIVEIDGETAYAIVEPGVSFFDLYDEVQRRGLGLWPSVPALGWGSVLGNITERGFGYTPNGEHSQNQCGMEVVLPSGELLRTGFGAMKGNKAWPLYKGGYGPSLDGLFYQSNLGIVTKIGIHMTPAPEAYSTIELDVPRDEELVEMIGTLSDLMRRSVILNSPSVGNSYRIALCSGDPEVYAQLGEYCRPHVYVPDNVLAPLRAKYGWGYWRAWFALYGSVEMMPALIATVERAFSHIPGVKINFKTVYGKPGKLLKARPGGDVEEEEVPHSGIPTLAPLQTLDLRGEPNGGHVCFSPIIPASGRELHEWTTVAAKMIADAKFDFTGDFHVYGRYVCAIALIVYAPEEEDRVMRLMDDLIAVTAKMGYLEYRTHVRFMDKLRSHLDFNDGAHEKFTRRLKDMLDPKGILSQGKSGVRNSARAAL